MPDDRSPCLEPLEDILLVRRLQALLPEAQVREVLALVWELCPYCWDHARASCTCMRDC